MVPHTKLVSQETALEEDEDLDLETPQASPRKYEIIKMRVLFFGSVHLAAAYGLYLCFTEAKWQTIIFSCLLFASAQLGITAGAHRLWSHRCYKATVPLQILLIIFNSLACQFPVVNWVRDHRLHHKYSDTDADPHNATRGFFFSHIGWLLVKKHTDVKEKGKTIDMSDILANPLLTFQNKYGFLMISTIGFIIPTVIPIYCWAESPKVSWFLCICRFAMSLNATFLTNSAAHIWGNKPYDKYILPTQNKFASFWALGEGFHNYHHSFPWDYKAAELGNEWLNLTTYFINFFAWIGWAYDLRTVSHDVLHRRIDRTGDGSYQPRSENKQAL